MFWKDSIFKVIYDTQDIVRLYDFKFTEQKFHSLNFLMLCLFNVTEWIAIRWKIEILWRSFSLTSAHQKELQQKMSEMKPKSNCGMLAKALEAWKFEWVKGCCFKLIESYFFIIFPWIQFVFASTTSFSN